MWTKEVFIGNLEREICRNVRMIENANQRQTVLRQELERIDRELTDLSQQGTMLQAMKSVMEDEQKAQKSKQTKRKTRAKA